MTGVEAIKATVDELIKALSARNIMGEPIETEDKRVLIIPLSGQSAITEPVTSLADNIIEKVARYWESREKKPSRNAAVDIE